MQCFTPRVTSSPGPRGGPTEPAVAVIVPAHNEERLITDTLRALDRQSFDDVVHRDVLRGYRVIVVDNASTDSTAQVVADFIDRGTSVPMELVSEPEKGTGCAADTGARRAIELGAAFIARTDADTLPAPDWLARIVAPLLHGYRLVGGRVQARSDGGSSATVFNAVGRLWRVGHAVEWARTLRAAPHERRSFAVVGNNMAIDAEMYEESGGFPRTRIEDAHEDEVLHQRVRGIVGADGIALATNAVVRTSLRRLDEYGTRDFVTWYSSDDRGRPDRDADIR
ncbi:Glycosyl transferase family 2 [Williamsia deligens]|nr:Glycosyl transferase family 2 [Williamsia deligens]